jgi:hypothetical protein
LDIPSLHYLVIIHGIAARTNGIRYGLPLLSEAGIVSATSNNVYFSRADLAQRMFAGQTLS